MAEATRFVFSHQEVAEALVRKQEIHEGVLGLYVEFGIAAANIGPGPSDLSPAAIVPILKMGIQQFTEVNSLSVDAAVVNPKSSAT